MSKQQQAADAAAVDEAQQLKAENVARKQRTDESLARSALGSKRVTYEQYCAKLRPVLQEARDLIEATNAAWLAVELQERQLPRSEARTPAPGHRVDLAVALPPLVEWPPRGDIFAKLSAQVARETEQRAAEAERQAARLRGGQAGVFAVPAEGSVPLGGI